MATMPLLSPNESYKFQSALLDFATVDSEWSMYTNAYNDDDPDANDGPLPQREGSERLTKATKDLMSLDSSSLKWNESADRDVLAVGLSPPVLNPPFRPLGLPFQGFALPPSSFARAQHHQHQQQQHHQHHHTGQQQPQRPPLTVVPGHTLDSAGASDSQHSVSSVSADTTPPPPTPPTLKRPYPSSADLAALAGPSTHPSSAHGRHGRGSGASASSASGASVTATPASASASAQSSAPSSSSTVRPQAKKPRAAPQPLTAAALGMKPSLLSPSQKKANHIQSEQKRRANIRRGYEALCDTVPALREAIRAEEEALAQGQPADDEEGANARGKGKRKGRGRKSAGAGAGTSESGDKVDGRAGPRSENVVLQKTIDYINDLLSERTVLLNRLNRAHSRLGPGHPALAPLSQTPGVPPLWDRTWTGGTGIIDDMAEGDGAGGDSDDEDES